LEPGVEIGVRERVISFVSRLVGGISCSVDLYFGLIGLIGVEQARSIPHGKLTKFGSW